MSGNAIDDNPCSRCGEILGDGCRINVTMPTVGVVDLCQECWRSLIEWGRGMKPARVYR